MPDIELFLSEKVNTLTVGHAVVLFIAARVGLVLLRWVGRLLKFVVYLVASALLRLRWVVWICAYVWTRWQVDLGRAILDLHPDHLVIRPSVGGVQGTDQASANLKLEKINSSARTFGPSWGTDLRPDRLTQDNEWAAWAQRRDRRNHYDHLLMQELQRVLRFPPRSRRWLPRIRLSRD